MRIVEVRENLDHPNPAYVDLYHRIGERPFVENYLTLISKLGPNARVVEFGAGIGGLAIPLARQGIPVWAVEAQPDMVDVLARTALPSLTIIQSRIESL